MAKSVKVQPYAWIILIVCFIASVAAPLCMFKVATILTTLREVYNLSLPVAGMMVSIFTLTGFILPLPAGSIFQKLGLKWTCVVSLAFMVAGSLMGTFVKTGGALLASRFIEGAGTGLIAVAVPSGLAMWFPLERRGTAIGIWNTWMPVGAILAFAVVPPVVAAYTYKGAWWFTTIFAAVALVLCLFLVRMPRPEETQSVPAPGNDEAPNAPKVTLGTALNNRNVWFAFAVILCFGICINIVPTYYPTFAVTNGIMGELQISLTMTVENFFSMAWGLATGLILDRLSNRKLMFTWPMFVVAALFLVLFRMTSVVTIYLWLFAGYAAFSAFVITSVYTCVPELMHSPAETAYAMGMVAMGQNFGIFIGAPLVGMVAGAAGWQAAGISIAAILVIGAVFAFMIKLPGRAKQAA
jgi:predicted MFS family arabinose efflux permease